MKKIFILQICFLFILIFMLSANIFAEETKKVEKQSVTTETKNKLTEEEDDPSLLDKEFETVPNQNEEISSSEDDSWLTQKVTAKDKEINRKLKKQIVKTIFYLFIVIILIYLVLKFLGSGKINIPTLGLGKNRRNILKITERMFLQQGKVLYLIKAGEKNILIGVSENNINYLTDIKLEDTPTENEQKDVEQSETNSYFNLFPQIKPIEPKEETKKTNTEIEKTAEE